MLALHLPAARSARLCYHTCEPNSSSPMQCPDLLACWPCHKALQANKGQDGAHRVQPVVGAAGGSAGSTLKLGNILSIQAGGAECATAADATAAKQDKQAGRQAGTAAVSISLISAWPPCETMRPGALLAWALGKPVQDCLWSSRPNCLWAQHWQSVPACMPLQMQISSQHAQPEAV